MTNIFNYIQLLLGIVPAIISAVKAIELPGNGSDKAATVVQIILAALDSIAPDLAKNLGIDKVTGFVHTVINLVVAFFNKVGVFSKPAVPPAA